MATPEEIKQLFIGKLESKGFGCEDLSDEERRVVRVGWTTDAYKSLVIFVLFDDEGDSVHFQANLPISIPKDRLPNVLMAVNSANLQYRWICFCLTNEGEIMGKMDAIVDTATGGEEIFNLMMNFVGICEDANPNFMKAIWA